MAKTSFVPNPAKIKVIGLGGGGCNAVTRMVREEIQGVDFIAMNTDAQALAITEAPVRVQIGEKLTRGLGVGGDHNMGQKAAEDRPFWPENTPVWAVRANSLTPFLGCAKIGKVSENN